MKVSLTVLVPGKAEGKRIPISVPKFLIGRDERCHLRAASTMVSKRHCLLLVRENRLFIQDLGSTNGTLVNDRQISGKVQLSDQDRLTVGPLSFAVSIEAGVPAPALAASAPAGRGRNAERSTMEDSAADLLLAMQGEVEKTTAVENACTDSTLMDRPMPSKAAEQPAPEPAGAAEKKKEIAKPATPGNTSAAAKALLDKYLRRPR
jgi:pSer/pThr/pTyr-binding forkhead associated (FHA) protein